MKTPVTVLGLGAMGSALARAFLAAGHPTTVWNRTPDRSPELDALGAVRARTTTEAVAASPLVVVCLLVDAPLRAALEGLDLTGKAVVNLTNATPEQARATAESVTSAGGQYLDGGIMAVPEMIGGPAAFIFYSGSTETVQPFCFFCQQPPQKNTQPTPPPPPVFAPPFFFVSRRRIGRLARHRSAE